MNHNTVFFNILKSSLWGTAIVVPQESDEWGKVFALAKAQSVLGLVANAVLSDAEVARRIPDDMQKRLKAFVMSSVGMTTRLNQVLLRCIDILREAGIEPVLLKGQGLAQYYPKPSCRQSGDIDLYVVPEDFDKAVQVLLTLSDKPDSPHQTRKHIEIKIGNVIIELHRICATHPLPRYDSLLQTYTSDGLVNDYSAVNIGGLSIRTPSNTFNAFYVFYHLWRHFLTEGVGLRQLCDLMMLLHSRKDYIDVSCLDEMLVSLNLMKPWKVFGCVLVDSLGMPSSEYPFYDNSYSVPARKVLNRILIEGNFGHERSYYKSRKKSYIWMKLHAFWCHLSRYFCVALIFPSHAISQFWYIASTGLKAVFSDLFIKK